MAARVGLTGIDYRAVVGQLLIDDVLPVADAVA